MRKQKYRYRPICCECKRRLSETVKIENKVYCMDCMNRKLKPPEEIKQTEKDIEYKAALQKHYGISV